MPAIRIQVSTADEYHVGHATDWDERYAGVYFVGDLWSAVHRLLDYLNYEFSGRENVKEHQKDKGS